MENNFGALARLVQFEENGLVFYWKYTKLMKETGHCFDDEEVTLKQTCSLTPTVPQNPPSSFFKYVKPDPQSPDLLYKKTHK